MSRKNKKSRSKRGSRTAGGGSAKNRRHSGNKGGKGKAGGDKHKYRKVIQENPRYFGKHGFTRPPQLRETAETINVGELDEVADELLDEGLAEEEGGEIVIDASELGYDKVLGSGQVTRSLRVKADNFSEKAKNKLEDSGGSAESGES